MEKQKGKRKIAKTHWAATDSSNNKMNSKLVFKFIHQSLVKYVQR